MAKQHPCIQCQVTLTSRSHAVACFECGRWNHRKCGTNISHQQYFSMRRGHVSIHWRCRDCVLPVYATKENSISLHDKIPKLDDVPLSPLKTIETGSRIDEPIPVVSFDIPRRQFVHSDPLLEVSAPEYQLTEDVPEPTAVTYEIVDSGTQRGAPKLVSSDGYTYTRGVKCGERRYWRCSIRNRKMNCPASIKEFMGCFIPGLGGHIHPADLGAPKDVKITKRVKSESKSHMFEPAAAIVERVMNEMVSPSDVNLPKPANLVRAANRHRQLRPDEATTLN